MWILVLSAIASAPETCDGIDNDIDGLVDEGGVCGASSLLDASTGNAYTVLPAGPGDERTTACGAIGYHPADPTSAAENSLLEVYAGPHEYWIGFTRDDEATLDSTGALVAFDAWFGVPGDDGGCTRIGDLTDTGAMSWRWVNDLTCGAAVYEYLCEADCERIVVYADDDGDGYGAGPTLTTCAPIQDGYSVHGDDCNDQSVHDYPGASEVCDSADNDCDGHIDEDATGGTLWYLDTDGDGAGDDSTGIESCEPIADRVSIGGDCAPDDPLVHPFAPEACVDGVDNDCDTLIDSEDPDFENSGVVFWQDSDGDGVGNPNVAYMGCSGTQPIGYVSTNNGEDCDDGNNLRSPLLPEVCDQVDNNCDGVPDNGLFFLDYWPDHDGDGFGDDNTNGTNACQAPPGLVGNQLDCDDADPHINPFANELCDDIDNDCNGLSDDGLPGHDYYPDLDGDGFGDQQATPQFECSPPDDLIPEGTDCDDSDAHIHPGAPEDPEDGIDSDCDGASEHPPPPSFVDSDGDTIPDAIDPTPQGYELDPAPTPAAADYGFGCRTSRVAPHWLGVIRR